MRIQSISVAPLEAPRVEVFIADRPEAEAPAEWLRGQVGVATSERVNFAALQKAALQKLRSALDAEIQRLEDLLRDPA